MRLTTIKIKQQQLNNQIHYINLLYICKQQIPWPAGAGGVLKIARRIWQVGVAGWPVTGRRRGRSQHYCGGLDTGFQWWRSGSGDITRTQMLASTCMYSLYA